MKNLFKVFGLGITFLMMSFTSSTNSLKTSVEMEVAEDYACVPTTLSCGKSGEVCGVSTEQILTQVEHAEDYWCS